MKKVLLFLIIILFVLYTFIPQSKPESKVQQLTVPYSSLFLEGRYLSPLWTITRTYGILLDEIIRTESGGDPTAQNPYSTAYGLCQFIDGTWQYVQDKWNVALDRYDPKDQLYACERLLEEEGIKHWPAIEE